jgi:cytochrome P450
VNGLFLDPDLFASGRAHAVFGAARAARGNVFRVDEDWAVIGRAELVAVASDPVTFTSARGTTPGIELDAPVRAVHLSDGATHAALRRAFGAAIGAARVSIEAEVAARVAAWPRGEPIDAVATLADPVPLAVMARMLGEDVAALAPVILRFTRAEDPRYRGDGGFAAAEAELWRGIDAAIARRHDAPGGDGSTRHDDAIARLAGAIADPIDLRFAVRFLALAAYHTTALAIAAAVVALCERPFEGGDADRAADEILRHASPVLRFARTCTREVALAGCALRAGDRVVMFYPAANRDPRVYADPDRVDFARAASEPMHVALGAGPHACLGGQLARAQVAAVIAALRGRRLALVEPPRAIRSRITAGYDRVLVRAV